MTYNIVSINTEFTKLLVPSPQEDGSDQDKGFISGIFSSFGDAEGGFSEELRRSYLCARCRISL